MPASLIAEPTVPLAAESRADERKVFVELVAPGRAGTTGRVLQTDDGVTEVRFENDPPPSLPVGGEAVLRLQVRGLRDALNASVQVLRRSDDAAGRRSYGFQLPRMGRPGGAFTAALAALFNRRASHRVKPPPLSRVAVRLEAEEGELCATAPLADISTGGLAIQVGHDVEELFAEVDRVCVSVRLPETKRSLRIPASIRSRRLCGRQVRYGLEFDAEPDRRAVGNARTIMGYVMGRQRHCLNEAARRSPV